MRNSVQPVEVAVGVAWQLRRGCLVGCRPGEDSPGEVWKGSYVLFHMFHWLVNFRFTFRLERFW